MMLLMRFQTIKDNKKDIHSPPVVAKQPMGIRRKGMTVPCRLMNANLRLIIAYWNIYVKSLYLFECESLWVFGLGIFCCSCFYVSA